MQTSLYQLLRTNPVFNNLDRYDFSVIESYLYFRELQASELMFQEGSHGDYMAFVVAGEIEVFKHDSSGKTIRIAIKGVGDSIGDMALLDELSRSASCRALGRTGIIVLPRVDFERILVDHPAIGVKMLKGIATSLSLNLRHTSEKLTNHQK